MRGFQAHSFMNSFLEANGCCNIVCGRHLTVSTVDFPLTKSSHWYCSNRPCRFSSWQLWFFSPADGIWSCRSKKKNIPLGGSSQWWKKPSLVFVSPWKNCCYPIFLTGLCYNPSSKPLTSSGMILPGAEGSFPLRRSCAGPWSKLSA